MNLLEQPPLGRVKSMRAIETAASEGANVKVGRFGEEPSSYAISYKDGSAHFIIPLNWNSDGEKISLRKALIQISTRQKS